MAEEVEVSKDTVQRVWSARGLKPHLVDAFKLSNDPRFQEELIDVVGLGFWRQVQVPRSPPATADERRQLPPSAPAEPGESTGAWPSHDTATNVAPGPAAR